MRAWTARPHSLGWAGRLKSALRLTRGRIGLQGGLLFIGYFIFHELFSEHLRRYLRGEGLLSRVESTLFY